MLKAHGGMLAQFSEPELSSIVAVCTNNRKLKAAFCPSRLNGSVLLFSAARGEADNSRRSQRWAEHATQKIIRHSIDCHHGELMRPARLAEIGRIISGKLSA